MKQNDDIESNIRQIGLLIDSIEPSKLSVKQMQHLKRGVVDSGKIISAMPSLSADFQNSFSKRIADETNQIIELDSDRGAALIAAIRFDVCCSNIVMVQYTKIYELGSEMLAALSKEKILIASMIARALHEMSAFNCYVMTTVDKKLDAVERQLQVAKIITELESVVKFLEKAFYGSSSKATGMSHIDIKKGRRELCKIWKSEASNYNRLCDYVHPNYGSNVIYGNGELSELSMKDRNNGKEKQLLFLANHLKIVVDQLDKFLMAQSSRILFFSKLRGRIKQTDFKIQNLFKPLKTNSKNNSGQSFDDAIDLSNLPSIEVIPEIYRQLADKNLQMLSRKIETFEGQLFDVITTNSGDYFFKLGSK